MKSFVPPHNEDARGMSSRAGRAEGAETGAKRGAGTDSIICICTHARQGTGRNRSSSSRSTSRSSRRKGGNNEHDDDADEAVPGQGGGQEGASRLAGGGGLPRRR